MKNYQKEFRTLANEAEAIRNKLDWPFFMDVFRYKKLNRVVFRLASTAGPPIAWSLPLEEALKLKHDLNEVIDSIVGCLPN